MKTLNELIEGYTNHLKQGEIQTAYKGILEFLGKLRAAFIKNHPDYDVISLYQGYMDMSYFSLSTKVLKAKGLKIAIVYLHEKGDFEIWLSARNRAIAKGYASIFNGNISVDTNVFHDSNNPDAIIECLLTAAPNFDDQSALIKTIDQGVEKFVTTIIERL